MKSETYKAEDYLLAADHLGVELVIGSDREDVFSSRNKGVSLSLQFNNIEQSVSRVKDFNEHFPIDGVVAVEDEGTILSAAISQSLGLINNSEESVVASNNKKVFRDIIKSAGLPSPWFKAYSVETDPDIISREIHYPCVLKPLSLSGSRGVIRANNTAEFSEAFRRIKILLEKPDVLKMSGATSKEILVESFIPGEEVAYEGLLDKGVLNTITVFDKPIPLEGPFFEESIYITPSKKPTGTLNAIEEMVKKGVEALGLRNGPVHAELRIDGNIVTMIELAPRGIGGKCSRLLHFESGFSEEELILRQALSMSWNHQTKEDEYLGVMMIPTPKNGILKEYSGLDKIREMDGISDIEITVTKMSQLEPLPEGSRYLGFIFASGTTSEKVQEILLDAHNLLHFTIE